MQRYLPTALVVGLLVATTIAFGLSESLKLEKSPITSTRVAKTFSPVCNCPSRTAQIRFRLRSADRVTVAIEHEGATVRTLIRRERHSAGFVDLRWDGRDDNGVVLPDASYRPRIQLVRARRTIWMPNLIKIDTKRPQLSQLTVVPRILSPDADGRRDKLIVRYRVSEPAIAHLYVNGKQRYRGRFRKLENEARWYGIVAKRPVRAGEYKIALEARDPAGNVSVRRTLGSIRVRYVELPPGPIRLRPNQRFRVRIDTDVKELRWRIGPRRGFGTPNLVLRGPRSPGRYWLYVTARGHTDRVLLLARKAP